MFLIDEAYMARRALNKEGRPRWDNMMNQSRIFSHQSPFQAIVSGDNLFWVILKTLFTRQPTILGNVYIWVSELKIESKASTFNRGGTSDLILINLRI